MIATQSLPILACLLSLLSQLHQTTAVYRVYICRRELQSYFRDSPHFDTIKDHHVDIIRNNESKLSEDGSLVLSDNEDPATGSGSGLPVMMMMMLEPMDQLLPPLPAQVDTITVSWHANIEVLYDLSIGEEPVGYFSDLDSNITELTGNIPTERSGFTLHFPCHPSSDGEGRLLVNLTTTVVSTGFTINANFHINKLCERNETVQPTPSRSSSLPSAPPLSRSFPTLLSLPSQLSTPSLSTTLTPLPSLSTTLTPLPSLSTTLTPLPSLSTTLTPLPSLSTTLTPPQVTSTDFDDMFTSEILMSISSTSSNIMTTDIAVLVPLSTEQPEPSTFFPTTSKLFSSPPPSQQPSSTPSLSIVTAIPSSTPSLSIVTAIPSSTPLPFSSTIEIESSEVVLPLVTSSGLANTATVSPSTTIVASLPVLSSSMLPVSTPVVKPTPSLSSSSVTSQPLTSTPATLIVTSSTLLPESQTISSFSASPSSHVSGGVGIASQMPGVFASTSPTVLLNGTEIEREPQLLELMVIVFAPVVGILIISITILVCFIVCVTYRKRKPPPRCFSDDPLDMPVPIVTGGGGFMAGDEDDLLDSLKKNEPPLTLWMSLSWGTVSHLPASIQGVSKHFEIDRRNLTILSTVSRGEYGSIVNGQMAVEGGGEDDGDTGGYTKGVMMKLLTGFQKQYGHRDEITKFLERATLLRGLDHPNIQCVLKVSIEDNYIPIVVYPIVEYGNMHNFLTFCRITPTESPLNGAFAQYQYLLKSNTVLPVTQHHKLNFALQIASAMNHLSENGIIHPDLALRNCLLDTNYTVKVADGALSQQNYPECYYTVYGTVRPVRWAAIETLQEGLCTTQSNVWSYGVTMWEVMTLAELPYSDVDNNRSILSQLMMDSRLPQPEDCSDNLYSLMMSCWKLRGEERPNFPTLLSLLQQMTEGPRPPQPPPTTTTYVRIPSVDIEQYDRDREPFALSTDPAYLRQSTDCISKLSPPVNPRGLNRYSSEQLSLTFSVLSCNTQGEEEEEGGSEHSSDNEADEISPIMMAPLLTSTGLERGDLVAPFNAHHGSNNLMSTFHSGDELELQTSSLSHLAGHASPTTPSTVHTWLTPFENASYTSRRETLRSDDTSSSHFPQMSSPSPDLTSKTSTIGDETMSTISNTNVPTHSIAEDSVSKTSSTIESASISTLATPSLSSVITAATNNDSRSNAVMPEQQQQQHSGLVVNGSTTKSPLFVRHSKTNGNALYNNFSTPNTSSNSSEIIHSTSTVPRDLQWNDSGLNKHERSMSNGVVDGKSNTENEEFEPIPTLVDDNGGGLTSNNSGSGGLGIDFSDLSSAFESWNLSS